MSVFDSEITIFHCISPGKTTVSPRLRRASVQTLMATTPGCQCF